MKKFIGILLMIFSVLTVSVYPVSAASHFAAQNSENICFSGDGSSENPYIITTAKELDAARENLSANYKLGNDIDLTEYLSESGDGYVKWNESGWEPIGSPDKPFTGNFDGANHVISGLWINRPDAYVGLFGAVYPNDKYSSIQNLGVGIAEKGIVGSAGGGLVGYSKGEIINCYVTGGSIKGLDTIGGLIGNQDVIGLVFNSHADIDVISEESGILSGSHIGGLIGDANGFIQNCYAVGNVKGYNYCGGLLGEFNTMTRVINCYAKGDVIGSGDNIGGLVGYCMDGFILYSYSTGNVKGNNYIGGLVGLQGGKSSIRSCYSLSKVSSEGDHIGGLVGAQSSPPYFENFNTIENCCVGGSIKTSGERFGAISGYTDAESAISNCLRYDTFTVNGNVIPNDDKNSGPNNINGAEINGTSLLIDKDKYSVWICPIYWSGNGVLNTVIYNSQGDVVKVYTDYIDSESGFQQYDYSDIPDAYRVKTMLWNDLDQIRPFCEAAEIYLENI